MKYSNRDALIKASFIIKPFILILLAGLAWQSPVIFTAIVSGIGSSTGAGFLLGFIFLIILVSCISTWLWLNKVKQEHDQKFGIATTICVHINYHEGTQEQRLTEMEEILQNHDDFLTNLLKDEVLKGLQLQVNMATIVSRISTLLQTDNSENIQQLRSKWPAEPHLQRGELPEFKNLIGASSSTLLPPYSARSRSPIAAGNTREDETENDERTSLLRSDQIDCHTI